MNNFKGLQVLVFFQCIFLKDIKLLTVKFFRLIFIFKELK